MLQPKTYYKRNLPHWHPIGRSLTWRLHGSLPETVVNELRMIRQHLRQKWNHRTASDNEAKVREYKRLFVRVDSILDRATSGPLWLGINEIASLMQQTLLERYAQLYILWAYVVMANHVHVFLKPKHRNSIEDITKRIKGYTARQANCLIGRTGQKFWQDESYDHWSRDEKEFFRIVDYIENNPVKAGLVATPQAWPWSSAAERMRRGWKEFRALT